MTRRDARSERYTPPHTGEREERVMDGKILVVGGYGSVGRTISTALGTQFPGQVIAAGRNDRKARELAAETQQRVLPLALDVATAHERSDLLNDVALVVMCIDQTDTRFVEHCLRNGTHYIDITATYDLLSHIEALDAEAKHHGATAILSVGLAPGLTNLLASHCQSVFDVMQRVDIFIMLGLGEVHGEASLRWVVENLHTAFWVKEGEMGKRGQGFTESRATVFPNNIGRRTAYRFNFSDQHVIPATLGIDAAATWLCFDAAWVTRLFALAKQTGLSRILRWRTPQEMLLALLRKLHVGSDRFVIKVDARGMVKHQPALYACALSGHGEARTTGLVAAEVAKRLYQSWFPAGVWHMEQVFEPLDVFETLRSDGVSFAHWHRPSPETHREGTHQAHV